MRTWTALRTTAQSRLLRNAASVLGIRSLPPTGLHGGNCQRGNLDHVGLEDFAWFATAELHLPIIVIDEIARSFGTVQELGHEGGPLMLFMLVVVFSAAPLPILCLALAHDVGEYGVDIARVL